MIMASGDPICGECGKYLALSRSDVTGEHLCSVTGPHYTGLYLYTETIPQGWQCPKCKIIHSPTVLSCDCDIASKEGEPQKWETTTDAPDTGYISPQTTV
jgi:hypothetical protein